MLITSRTPDPVMVKAERIGVEVSLVRYLGYLRLYTNTAECHQIPGVWVSR